MIGVSKRRRQTATKSTNRKKNETEGDTMRSCGFFVEVVNGDDALRLICLNFVQWNLLKGASTKVNVSMLKRKLEREVGTNFSIEICGVLNVAHKFSSTEGLLCSAIVDFENANDIRPFRGKLHLFAKPVL